MANSNSRYLLDFQFLLIFSGKISNKGNSVSDNGKANFMATSDQSEKKVKLFFTPFLWFKIAFHILSEYI